MSIGTKAKRISMDRSGDILEGLLAKISEIDRDLAANLFVSGGGDTDATRLSDPLKPSRSGVGIAKIAVAEVY